MRSLSHPDQRNIFRYLRERIATDEDPRRFGKALTGEKSGLWRYRVGSCRLVCHIEDDRSVVFVIGVGYRKEVYD